MRGPPCVLHVCLRLWLQCVELDFHYPSEGIHKRWDVGYRITCSAATHDQTGQGRTRDRQAAVRRAR